MKASATKQDNLNSIHESHKMEGKKNQFPQAVLTAKVLHTCVY